MVVEEVIVESVAVESGTGEVVNVVVEEVIAESVAVESLETYMAKGEKPLSCLDLLSKIKDKNEQAKITDWFTGNTKWESFKESINTAIQYVSSNLLKFFLSDTLQIPTFDETYRQTELLAHLSSITVATECMDFYNTIFVNPDYKVYRDYLKKYNPSISTETLANVTDVIKQKITDSPEAPITSEIVKQVVDSQEIPVVKEKILSFPDVSSANISPSNPSTTDNLKISNVSFKNQPVGEYAMSYQWQYRPNTDGYYDNKYLSSDDIRSYHFGDLNKKQATFHENVSSVDIGFDFDFYGETYKSVNISKNNFLSFSPLHDFLNVDSNLDLPLVVPFGLPANALDIDESKFFTQTFGTAPERSFEVMWSGSLKNGGDKIKIYMQFYEKDDSILISYKKLPKKINSESTKLLLSPNSVFDAKYNNFVIDYKKIFSEKKDIIIFPKSNFTNIAGATSEILSYDQIRLGGSYRVAINNTFTSNPVTVLKKGSLISNIINSIVTTKPTVSSLDPISNISSTSSTSGSGWVVDTNLTVVNTDVSQDAALTSAISANSWTSMKAFSFTTFPDKTRILVLPSDQVIYDEQKITVPSGSQYLIVKLSNFKDKYSDKYIDNDLISVAFNGFKSTGTEINTYRYYIFPVSSLAGSDFTLGTFINFLANTQSGVYHMDATYTLK